MEAEDARGSQPRTASITPAEANEAVLSASPDRKPAGAEEATAPAPPSAQKADSAAEPAQQPTDGGDSAAAAAAIPQKEAIVIKDEPDEPGPVHRSSDGGESMRRRVVRQTRDSSMTVTDVEEEEDVTYEPHGFKRTRFQGVDRPLWSAWCDAYADILDPEDPSGKRTLVFLGSFASPQLAARAHDVAVLLLGGDPKTLNYDEDNYREVPFLRAAWPDRRLLFHAVCSATGEHLRARDRTKHSMGVVPAVNGMFEVRVPASSFDMLPKAARHELSAAARQTAALAVVDSEAAARTLKPPADPEAPPAAFDLRAASAQHAQHARARSAAVAGVPQCEGWTAEEALLGPMHDRPQHGVRGGIHSRAKEEADDLAAVVVSPTLRHDVGLGGGILQSGEDPGGGCVDARTAGLPPPPSKIKTGVRASSSPPAAAAPASEQQRGALDVLNALQQPGHAAMHGRSLDEAMDALRQVPWTAPAGSAQEPTEFTDTRGAAVEPLSATARLAGPSAAGTASRRAQLRGLFPGAQAYMPKEEGVEPHWQMLHKAQELLSYGVSPTQIAAHLSQNGAFAQMIADPSAPPPDMHAAACGAAAPRASVNGRIMHELHAGAAAANMPACAAAAKQETRAAPRTPADHDACGRSALSLPSRAGGVAHKPQAAMVKLEDGAASAGGTGEDVQWRQLHVPRSATRDASAGRASPQRSDPRGISVAALHAIRHRAQKLVNDCSQI
eukprot:jgi/Ulvmu1/2812/UM142_0010.1